jgi:PncC family amidohydrolase
VSADDCGFQAAGGLVSSALLSFPGASKIYKGGLTLYTLESRIAFAGWTQDDIDAYRGPTCEIVTKIAQNVRNTLKADYCICESGTAGPTGGNTQNRQPGYCALAVSGPSRTNSKEVETSLGTDRQANMVAFAREALLLLEETLKQDHPKL